MGVLGSVAGKRSSPEPEYRVAVQDGDMEIREYGTLLLASTVVPGGYGDASGVAFRRLAGFIFGRNTGQEKISMTAPVLQRQEGVNISMTAPVLQEKAGDAWRMSFIMPGMYTMETVPRPLDEGILLEELPPRRVAVLRYTGLHSVRNIEKRTKLLVAWLEKEGYRAVSEPRVASYDPPWTIPALRRNEIHIDIER